MSEFFSMGGYGAYIWSAYGITFLVLALIWFVSRQQYQSKLNRLRQLRRQDLPSTSRETS